MLTINDVYQQRRQSKIPSTTPDKHQYPLYYQARNVVVTLNPGDILYIPYGWWHFVTSQDVDPKTKMNIAFSNWTLTKECDCKVSYDPNKYRIQCPTYKYDQNKFEKLVSIHTKLSLPFINQSNLHQNCNIDYKTLKRDLPDEIPIFHSKTNFFTSQFIRYFNHDNCYKDIFSFDEFYEMGMNGEHVYLGQLHTKDTSLNTISLHPEYVDNFIWVNFGNVTSNLHYDTEDNLLLQVQGTKQVILFPPSEREKLYPYNPYPPNFLCYLISRLKD